MLQFVNDFDEIRKELITEAAITPNALAGEELFDFIAVRTANDKIRRNAINQLFSTMQEIAKHANRKNANIIIQSTEPHHFSIGQMNLSGAMMRFRRGIRCMTVEAGWTRTPKDGFMRGNALAIAKISHFGMTHENVELHLIKFENRPHWFKVDDEQMRISFELEDLIGHFQIFLEIS
jgi:hypothetical protein